MNNQEHIDDLIRQNGELKDRIRDLQELLTQQTLHTEILDKNWQSHHDAGLNCLKSAIGIDLNSSIPEMVYKIDRLIASGRTA